MVHLSSRDQVAGGFWRRNEVSDRRLQVAKGAFAALDVAVEEKERGGSIGFRVVWKAGHGTREHSQITFFFFFQAEQQVVEHVKRPLVCLVRNHARFLQQEGLDTGATGDPLLFIKMKAEQLAKATAVVVAGRFGVAKSFQHEPIADDAILQVHRVGLLVHVHYKLSDFLGSFRLAGAALAADDHALACGDAVQQVVVPDVKVVTRLHRLACALGRGLYMSKATLNTWGGKDTVDGRPRALYLQRKHSHWHSCRAGGGGACFGGGGPCGGHGGAG